MIKTHILGFPRIGEHRELKFALEKHWRGELDELDLKRTAAELRKRHWQLQIDSGLDFITVGDFAYYDQMADHIDLFGCQPERFKPNSTRSPLQNHFLMVRGKTSAGQPTQEAHALEMTKWFDTNYHYMVPEFTSATRFKPNTQSLLEQLDEALALGHAVKVSLIGPLTFLYLGKSKQAGFSQLTLLPQLLAAYRQVLHDIAAKGVKWVQIDEPVLALDIPTNWLRTLESNLLELKQSQIHILLATYFGSTQGHTSLLCKLPIDGLHLDCVRAEGDLPQVLDWLPNYKVLSLGLVDGRNIWRTDLDRALQLVSKAFESGKGELWLATSCSLLHSPYRFGNDEAVKREVQPWLAGAVEKLGELQLLKEAGQAHLQASTLPAARQAQWQAHQQQVNARLQSPLLQTSEVRSRIACLNDSHDQRQSPFAQRQPKQQKRFTLPALPTTTIGSFPQTQDIRQLRAQLKRGEISPEHYSESIRAEIRKAIEFQESLGLDVLVHGEAERNDMVEFFGEQLAGYTFSANGWVQSYGSRCVKPPILYGDVYRPHPMTVATASYAQSLTKKPVKGMLTGPITMLQWSFVRDDQPRKQTALQLALAIRDEVDDLQTRGIGMIQIDEPAFREGLPLRQADWPEYLQWAGKAFRISASIARDDTQIHTHMCYSEFNDILPAIAAMDADVITIETSRSDMELLRGFGQFRYPNEIGPGVYDIHSPRVPPASEMVRLLEKAMEVIPANKLWVNPDCGLKTRAWPETQAALTHMVQAANLLRKRLETQKTAA